MVLVARWADDGTFRERSSMTLLIIIVWGTAGKIDSVAGMGSISDLVEVVAILLASNRDRPVLWVSLRTEAATGLAVHKQSCSSKAVASPK